VRNDCRFDQNRTSALLGDAEALLAVERGELAAMRGLSKRERQRLHRLLERLVGDDTPPLQKRFR
jgi:hypothetical protein